MFCDKFVLGTILMSVDSKSRIFLPKIVNANENEKMVLINKNDYIEVRSFDNIKLLLKDYYEKSIISEDENIRENYNYLIDDLTSSIIAVRKIGSENRLLLGMDIYNDPNILNKCSKVVIEGRGDYLRIWSDSKFLEHKDNIAYKKTRKLSCSSVNKI